MSIRFPDYINIRIIISVFNKYSSQQLSKKPTNIELSSSGKTLIIDKRGCVQYD